MANPVEFFTTIEKNQTIRILNIATMSEDSNGAKKYKFLLRAVKRNIAKGGRIKFLNVSENYLNAACFHCLKEVLLKNRNIRTLKFYS